MVVAVDEIPLLDLFTRLKDAGLPLGVGEYQLALQALQAGFGLTDRESLARLCRTLWIKSSDEARIFEYHFEQFFPSPASTNGVVSELSVADKSLSPKKQMLKGKLLEMIGQWCGSVGRAVASKHQRSAVRI